MKRLKDTSSWVRLFFGAGVGATALKILQLTTGLGRQLRPPSTGAVPEVGSAEFVEALGHALGVPMRRGGSVTVLENGASFFPHLMERIRAARDSIHIMTYIWRPGDLSRQLMDLLLEKARAGVDVRVLMDGIGSLVCPWRDIRRLREAGGTVIFFSPVLSRHVTHLTRRNHSRAFVVDGRIAYTGGIAIADEWTGNAQDPAHWRDTMVAVTGEPVHELQGHFARFWAAASGEVLTSERYYPLDAKADDGPRYLGLAHYASNVVQPLRDLYWYSLQAARDRIFLTNAYFAPDHHMRNILCERARAGIDVRLLLPGHHIDSVVVRWNAHTLYGELLESGIRIFEYQPTMLHARHIVIDGAWTLVGSPNLDVRSIRLNHENMLGIQDATLGRQFEAMFARDCADATEITLDAWRNRPTWKRLRNHAAASMKAQY